jgi:hypothetical protein
MPYGASPMFLRSLASSNAVPPHPNPKLSRPVSRLCAGDAPARGASAYGASMARETFQDLVDRIEAIAVRVAREGPDAAPALTRDELVDVLDLLRRVAKAMIILQARGNLR